MNSILSWIYSIRWQARNNNITKIQPTFIAECRLYFFKGEEKIISRSEKTQDIKHGNLWFFVHRVFGDVGGLVVSIIKLSISALCIPWSLIVLHLLTPLL